MANERLNVLWQSSCLSLLVVAWFDEVRSTGSSAYSFCPHSHLAHTAAQPTSNNNTVYQNNEEKRTTNTKAEIREKQH